MEKDEYIPICLLPRDIIELIQDFYDFRIIAYFDFEQYCRRQIEQYKRCFNIAYYYKSRQLRILNREHYQRLYEVFIARSVGNHVNQ